MQITAFKAILVRINLHYLIYFFLDNEVMTSPKRWILLFVFTVLCLKKSLLIPVNYPVNRNLSGSDKSRLLPKWMVYLWMHCRTAKLYHHTRTSGRKVSSLGSHNVLKPK